MLFVLLTSTSAERSGWGQADVTPFCAVLPESTAAAVFAMFWASQIVHVRTAKQHMHMHVFQDVSVL